MKRGKSLAVINQKKLKIIPHENDDKTLNNQDKSRIPIPKLLFKFKNPFRKKNLTLENKRINIHVPDNISLVSNFNKENPPNSFMYASNVEDIKFTKEEEKINIKEILEKNIQENIIKLFPKKNNNFPILYDSVMNYQHYFPNNNISKIILEISNKSNSTKIELMKFKRKSKKK